ncbi:hypothetical protein CCHL11_02473 [Colletotrichum chlorophyti]|uniref:Zn(2)-C6 fungal-type domain-containing protein n=1 Tax=Colletotrichum chlorophyti TaxID=708187 RepID=A0A1Q8S916_9PEZI|nr:hypothetical protein CCHL11_02473 [Colletotrichum chlorophyti]
MGCRPSASCFACKARKVKCDLEKPSCKRCINLGRNCPGYADPWSIVHRQQNASAAHQVRVRVAKRLKERGDFGEGNRDDEGNAPEELVHGKAIPRPMEFDMELFSLNRFYANYSSGNEVHFFRILDSTRASKSSVYFEQALNATALASSALMTSQFGFIQQAKKSYIRACTKVNIAIQSPDAAQDDSVIIALLTLALFEAILPDTTPKAIRSHCRGSLALIRYRAEQGLATALDRACLSFISFLGVLEFFVGQEGRSAVLVGLKRATWCQGGIIEPLLTRAVNYKEQVQETIASGDVRQGPFGTANVIFEAGIDIIRDLEAAANYRITHPGPRKALAADGAEPLLNSFNKLLDRRSDASNALAKCLYLTVRLHVIEQILSLVIAVGEPTEEELGLLVNLPHGLTALEQVCEQIRVVIGFDGRESMCSGSGIGFQAWCMFWPMVAVLKSSFADAETKTWVVDKISRVGHASGFGVSMFHQGWFDETVGVQSSE